jgi:hypothetical protein
MKHVIIVKTDPLDHDLIVINTSVLLITSKNRGTNGGKMAHVTQIQIGQSYVTTNLMIDVGGFG